MFFFLGRRGGGNRGRDGWMDGGRGVERGEEDEEKERKEEECESKGERMWRKVTEEGEEGR